MRFPSTEMHHDPTQTARFSGSLARVTSSDDFFSRFYDRFMGDSDDIRNIFRGKDTDRIHRKLKTSLEMLADNAEGQPGLTMYLDMLGSTHRRLQIRPEHFARWREALITTAAEADPQWDTRIRAAWERVIDDMIAKLGADGNGS